MWPGCDDRLRCADASTAKQAPHVVLECHGVGYEVETPMSTFLELPAVGAELFLHTHLLVREDAQLLYGFASVEERALFRSLLKISGVGAKMGLAILSAMSEADFRRCVEHEDTASLVRIPGVGKKTAERLIIEMRDKFRQQTGTTSARRKRRCRESTGGSRRCAGIARLQGE